MNGLKSSCNAGWQVFLIVLVIAATTLFLHVEGDALDRWVHVVFIALASVAVIQALLYSERYEANDNGVTRSSILGKSTIHWHEVQDAYYIYYDCAKSVTVECVVLVKERHRKRYGYHRVMLLVLQKKAAVFSVSSQAYRGRAAVPYFDKIELVSLASKHGVSIAAAKS